MEKILQEKRGNLMSLDNASLNEFIKKGNNAYDKSNYKKAIEYYEKALEIAREIGNKLGEGTALGNLGLVYGGLGKIKKAMEYYEKALEIAREIGNKLGEGAALANLGLIYGDLGEVKRAIEYYEKALEIAREIGNKSGEGTALGNLGLVYRDLGEVKKAMEYYEKALEIAQEIGNELGEGAALANLGLAYGDLGEVKKAIEYYKKALEIARDIGNKSGEGAALANLGLVYGDLGEVNFLFGDWKSSLDLLYKSLEIYQEIENPTRQAEVLAKIGDLQIKSGDWEEAQANFNKSFEIFETTTPIKILDVLVSESELNISEGIVNNAYEKLQNAYEIVSKSGLNQKKICICIKLGKAKLIDYENKGVKDNISIAKKHLESALELAEKFQSPLYKGIIFRLLGILYSKNDQKKKSYTFFTQSFEIFRNMNSKYELAKTYFEFARILAENNELIKSEEIAKVCAFDCHRENFRELEIDTYILLGDIVWKQDQSQFGYYLDAFRLAIFNTRIYIKTFFLLLRRMKKMDAKTSVEVTNQLKNINKEIQIDSFFNLLLLKIEGKEYDSKELPEELIEELNNFNISNN